MVTLPTPSLKRSPPQLTQRGCVCRHLIAVIYVSPTFFNYIPHFSPNSSHHYGLNSYSYLLLTLKKAYIMIICDPSQCLCILRLFG